MLSMSIQYHPYTVIPTLLGSDFVDLKLLPTSILDMHKIFEHIDILSIVIW